MQAKPNVKPLFNIFSEAKEMESLCGVVPSVFKEEQFTLTGAMGELYSVFSNTARSKAAAAPGLPMALFCPTVLGARSMQRMMLNYLPYGMERDTTK